MTVTPNPPSLREASKALLRTTVLRSLDRLVRDHAWSEVTMAQVARAAGVSRQTLYNEFGTREDLARAYVQWGSEGLLDEIEQVIAGHQDDLLAALVAALEAFLAIAAEHPMMRALEASSGVEGVRALVSTPEGEPLVRASTARLAGIITATWPELPADEAVTTAETVVRLAISHLTVPTGTPAEAATRVGRLLGPYIDEIQSR